MSHKTLAIILVVLLGGMAIYYNQAVSKNASVGAASQLFASK